ncbi:SBBP repeat-containing protein [Nannocystis punicea]|uniref:SBBP repeat-containing protein n=1 Tax=Nannocystis punicea TaxID=2995304 RepID=A0ABY7HBD4_9BACT|nr:SBBP repeat-containing protein [Nannocystis poenicansa]WAS96364.1 SBBP repeat-containing protein [Nannocystis poenicansa]
MPDRSLLSSRHRVAPAVALPLCAAASLAHAGTEPTIAWGTYYTGEHSSSYLHGLGALPDGSFMVLGGPNDSFHGERISRFDASGRPQWSLLYAGAGEGRVIALTIVPGQSDFYVAGETEADEGIATAGAHQSTRTCFGHGARCAADALVARFDDTGERQWGTYFGGPFDDRIVAAAADATGALHVCGETGSPSGIATPDGYQTTLVGEFAGFVAVFEPTGLLRWATYYDDSCSAIALDEPGDAVYVAGGTEAGDLATPGAHQEAADDGRDAYLARFTGDGELVWSTYYGGPGDDLGEAVRVDADGAVYLLGTTDSATAIATAGAHQDRLGGSSDVFLVRFTAGGEREWATYFGGAEYDQAADLAVDDEGRLYLGATVMSDDLATPNAPRRHVAGGRDALVARFDGTGALEWATYYGGENDDYVSALALSPDGSVYLGGFTNSTTGIFTPGAYQEIGTTGPAAYIVRLLQGS